MPWKDFEDECVAFLQTTYGHLGHLFEKHGESVSGESDILVTTKNGQSFYIEAKEPVAQSGQFVALPDNGKFIFSAQNKDHANVYSREILDFMNDDYAVYSNPGTKGIDLPLPGKLMISWIKTHYNNKKVQFFITKDDAGAFIIYAVDQLECYVTVTAKYRVKKSGSTDPTRGNYAEITLLLNDSTARLIPTGKHLFLQSSNVVNGLRLIGEKYSYLFNEIKGGIFKVRRLSNTANPNVIFTIKNTGHQQPQDLEFFEAILELEEN